MEIIAASALPFPWEFSWPDELEVDYETQENANIIYSALAVDKELQPYKVRRQMSVNQWEAFSAF